MHIRHISKLNENTITALHMLNTSPCKNTVLHRQNTWVRKTPMRELLANIDKVKKTKWYKQTKPYGWKYTQNYIALVMIPIVHIHHLMTCSVTHLGFIIPFNGHKSRNIEYWYHEWNKKWTMGFTIPFNDDRSRNVEYSYHEWNKKWTMGFTIPFNDDRSRNVEYSYHEWNKKWT